MRKQVFVPSGALTLVTMLMLVGAPAGLQGQTPSREDAQEAARKASPHSADAAMAYWEAEIAKKLAEATERVYDPARPACRIRPRPRGALRTCVATT